MSDFALKLQAFADKTQAKVDRIVTGSILEFASRVEDRSPVDTGYFRAHWRISLDAPAPESAPGFTFPEQAAGHLYYYVNGTAYGRRLEYGFTGEDKLGRHYNQPGRGFVGLTVTEWTQIVAQQAARVA